MVVIYIAGLIAIIYGIISFTGDVVAILFLCGIIWFFFGLLVLKEHRTLKKAPPLERGSVVVVSKFAKQDIRGFWMWTNTFYTYFITFEFSNRERKKMKVDATQYGTISEEDSGIVEYKEYFDFAMLVNFYVD